MSFSNKQAKKLNKAAQKMMNNPKAQNDYFMEEYIKQNPEMINRIIESLTTSWHHFLEYNCAVIHPTPWAYFEVGTIISSHMKIATMYPALYNFMELMTNRNSKGEVCEDYEYLVNDGDRMFEFDDEEKARAFYDDCIEMKLKV